jgi:hypothetical protein
MSTAVVEHACQRFLLPQLSSLLMCHLPLWRCHLGRGQRIRRRIRRPPNCYSPSAFTATAMSELASYRDVILHPEWQHAMAEEIAALERTGTWDLMPCPPRVCLITCKRVYKVKTRSDGSLERYKACLVARGF